MRENKRGLDDFEINLEDVEMLIDTHLPDPTMLEYYRRLNKREIVWNDGIDDGTLDISLYIQKWNREDKDKPKEERTPIKIFINSDGGSLDAVFHVIDMIALSKTPVITVGMAKAYSAGGLLLMAGHKRYVFEHTKCLIHDGSSGAIGDTGKLMDTLKFTEKLEQRVKKFILDHTKIPETMYDENYRRDWFLFSDEMIEFGIADEIIDDIDTIL